MRSIRNWLVRCELHKEKSPTPQLKALRAFNGASNVIVLSGRHWLLPFERYYRKLILFTLSIPVVTISTTSLIFNNSTFCPHSVFMCYVWI